MVNTYYEDIIMNTLINSIIIKQTLSNLFTSTTTKDYKYIFSSHTGLFQLITLRNSFISTTSHKYNFKINTFYFNSNRAFIFITLTDNLIISSLDKSSTSKLNLCFIFSQISKFNWLIDFIISKEHSPSLYSDLLENKFDIYKLQTSLSDAIQKYSTTQSLLTSNKPLATTVTTTSISTTFDFSKSIEYAERYALDYNPKYISFNDSGGDCTNFASQSLHYGGVKETSLWKPYFNSWVRVNELRDFLIYNKLAREYSSLKDNFSGCLIQFFNKDRNAWTHSGILTYRTDTDYLYCCHTYDKLNYPLSLSYPIIYPKVRIIVPF